MSFRALIIMIVRGLFHLYKGCIAPFVVGSCRYYPSCSEYCVMCVDRYGVLAGTALAVRRLLRCRPGGGGGIDYPKKSS
jgi:putative membrane protein insertion efficiency factor